MLSPVNFLLREKVQMVRWWGRLGSKGVGMVTELKPCALPGEEGGGSR